jgi:hypothetical protein
MLGALSLKLEPFVNNIEIAKATNCVLISALQILRFISEQTENVQHQAKNARLTYIPTPLAYETLFSVFRAQAISEKFFYTKGNFFSL